MADPKEEAPGGAEFEQFGEQLSKSWLSSSESFPEAEPQLSFLADHTIDRERETRTYSYTRKTIFVAVAAAVVGIVGIVATIVAIRLTLGHL